MARIWTERTPSKDSKNRTVWSSISIHAHLELRNRPATSLDPHEILFVNVCSFTFNFKSLYELDQTLQFYRQKTHPSSRVASSRLVTGKWGHWKSLRWYERLPMYLMEESSELA